MEPNILASGAVCTILLIMAYFCIAWYISEYGKKQALQYQEYEHLYSRITYVIDEYDITEQTYDYLIILLDRLKGLKYKNKEMTDVLYNKFKLKYNEIHQRRMDLNVSELKKKLNTIEYNRVKNK